MNTSSKVCFACLSGVLCLSGVSIYANEQMPDEKIVQNINDSIHCATEAVDTENFTQKLFTELEDSDYVLQMDEGGYLYSTVKGAEELEQEFKANNGNAGLKKVTVFEAKDDLQAELENALSK